MQAWFLSDIHLKDINERNSLRLLRFLHSLQEDPKTTHLFFLGDIFDLWVGDSKFFEKKFQALVDAIAELKAKGVEVVYFEGNHDVQVRDFWQKKFGIPVWMEAKVYQLGPFKVRMEHGDYINPDDKWYLRYLELIRHPRMKIFADWVPGKFWDRAGAFASKKSRKKSYTQRVDRTEILRTKIRTFAETKAKEQDFDYIITGHMHVVDEHEFESGNGNSGKKRISINLGSWFEPPRALGLNPSGHFWRDL